MTRLYYFLTPISCLLSFHQLLIMNAFRCYVSYAFFPVFLIFGERTLEEIYLRIALKGKDMCAYSVEEPTVVRDDDSAAGEIVKSFFQSH